MVFGALSVNYLPHDYHWTDLTLLALFLSLWGSFGDLFESALKRTMGIKDTSHILMGHGGLWDRLDSLMFNLPVVYFFIFLGTKP
jgi:phosphatidate cytidylyltransferase